MSCLLFTVYDNRTDFPVIVDGTAAEAAKAMGINVGSFYTVSSGKVKRWVVLKRKINRGVYGKKKVFGNMSNECGLSEISESDS